MRSFIATSILALAASAALAQDDPAQTLITDVNVFDGVNAALNKEAGTCGF